MLNKNCATNRFFVYKKSKMYVFTSSNIYPPNLFSVRQASLKEDSMCKYLSIIVNDNGFFYMKKEYKAKIVLKICYIFNY